MATATLTSARPSLSQLLEKVCVNLQLRHEQVERATQSYGAVTDWLGADGSPVNAHQPLLFPQGSLALDTTVRPIIQNEFDLDVVCHLRATRNWKPEDLFDLIWDRMYEHGTYRKIMERMPRCIRLNYAEESQFHLDIVPAVTDPDEDGTCLLIPDANGTGMIYKPSNPKGFKFWFDTRKVTYFERHLKAQVEPLQRPLPSGQKAALTKCVQLLKRWRDVRWKDEPELATPSIMLTYLGADYYLGEEDIAEAMMGVLFGISEFVASGVVHVVSPSNPKEVISEKWLRKPACYQAFADAVVEFRDNWSDILSSKRGPALTAALAELFGDHATRAIKEASETVTRARADGSLHVTGRTGQLITGATAASLPVRTNTFFGD